MMDRQRQAYLCAGAAILFWATVASAFKITLRYLDVVQMLFYSTLVSTVALFFILVAQGKLGLLRTYSPRDYLRSACLGFLSPFLYYIILFKAYDMLLAQQAQPLNFTWPLMIVLLSIPLLKQRIRPVEILGCTVSFIGVVVVSTRGQPLTYGHADLPGASLAVGSSVIWALFWLYNVRDPRDEVAKLFLGCAFALIPTALAVLRFSDFRVGAAWGLAGAVYIGLFEMGITFVLWLKALTLARNTAQVSRFVYLAPFLSLVVIRFVVGETILLSTVIGLVLIVGGILVQQQWRKPVPQD
jgi:drug/metabolite transporter (DMT)-like permease